MLDKSRWPHWVRWIAQDEDGCWWAYSVEPLQHHKGWYENEVGQIIKLGQGEANPRWQDSLQKIKQALNKNDA